VENGEKTVFGCFSAPKRLFKGVSEVKIRRFYPSNVPSGQSIRAQAAPELIVTGINTQTR
jgi:hypothetical protein